MEGCATTMLKLARDVARIRDGGMITMTLRRALAPPAPLR
jgi:hypothetical protein